MRMLFKRWPGVGHRGQRFDRPAGPPNPFEGYLLSVCILQGVTILTGVSKPQTIQSLLPPALRVLWAVLLLCGGIAAVIGLYWRGHPVDAILIKRIGLFAAGMGTLAYGVALLTIWPLGLIAALMNLGFALACFNRIHQVGVALRAYRGGLQAAGDARIASAPRKPPR